MKKIIKSMSIMLCSMMMATVFTACGGDDDNGSPISGGGGTDNPQTTTKAKLVGTWQAVAAKGYYNDRTVDTKELWGLDSLSSELPPLIIINSDGTFESYRANFTSWKYINGREYPSAYTWKKSGPSHSSGEGKYLLVGNQIQLNDNYGYSYSTNATIVSLTNDRMVLRAMDGNTDITVTYSRDGYGAEYFTYPYVNRNIQYAGDWILTSCDNGTGAIGSTFTFNSDGTGYSKGYDANFTFNLESTGEFTLNLVIWQYQGIIHITDTEASGYYIDKNKQIYFTLTRK